MSDTISFALFPLQIAVQSRLQAHPWLTDIPAITEAKGDIVNEVKRALGELEGLNGKFGACIVILTPTATLKYPDAPGPILDGLSLVLSVIEHVELNQSEQGTKKHALEIVEFCLRYLHHWTVPGSNAALCVQSTPFKIVNADPLTYEVYFKTKLALKPESLTVVPLNP